MNKTIAKEFVGKEVKIYPSDTKLKCGKVIDADENGVVFEITSSRSEAYVVGKRYFIAYSANLIMGKV